jgi:hypothetical protein
MPKKYRKNSKRSHKRIRGGDLSTWWSNNVSNNSMFGSNSDGSGWFNRSKNYLSGLNPWSSSQSNNMEMSSTGIDNSQQYYTPSGGKRKTKKRGGFSSSTPNTGLASTASPVSGLPTAKAHNWVGGRTKHRRHKHSKTCRH